MQDQVVATRSYSTSDLSRKSGDIIADALQHPVTITQRSKPRLVLLSIDEYERLRGPDPRRALAIGELSDAELDEMQSALNAYLDAANSL